MGNRLRVEGLNSAPAVTSVGVLVFPDLGEFKIITAPREQAKKSVDIAIQCG